VGSWRESLLHLHYELGAKKNRSPPLPAAPHSFATGITSELILTCSPPESLFQRIRKWSSRIKKWSSTKVALSCPSCIKWLQAMFIHLCAAASRDKHHNPQHSPPSSANCAFHALSRAIWLSDAVRRQQCSYHLTAPTPDMPPPPASLPPLELPLSQPWKFSPQKLKWSDPARSHQHSHLSSPM
jgi:hypothetical protein